MAVFDLAKRCTRVVCSAVALCWVITPVGLAIAGLNAHSGFDAGVISHVSSDVAVRAIAASAPSESSTLG